MPGTAQIVHIQDREDESPRLNAVFFSKPGPAVSGRERLARIHSWLLFFEHNKGCELPFDGYLDCIPFTLALHNRVAEQILWVH